MEWIGTLVIGFLVFGGITQLFSAHATSVIARKTDQSEFMQVLAWIPVLQIAPALAAGGGSVGRFLLGTAALVAGNAVLFAVAALLADAFSTALAAFGLALSGLLALFYFGRIAHHTAIARNLPSRMSLLLFVPILNFVVYPYFAFHDGWAGPNKLGLTIGSLIILCGMVPTFQVVRQMDESGGLPASLFLAIGDSQPSQISGITSLSDEIVHEAQFSTPLASPAVQPKPTTGEKELIRALYQLKGRFDSLESLATPENLLIHDHRLRALRIIHTIRADLETRREMLDAATYGELATHLLEIEALVHARTDPAYVPTRLSPTTHDSQLAPAALDSTNGTRTPPTRNDTAPPIRPYPVQASEECPLGTETRTRENADGEEEWCQQLSAYGGLRHGWYARYHKDGRPESMGRYHQGLRVGVWTRFYPSGEVRAQAEFREGMQHGWVLTFNPAGERTRSARFEDGVPLPPNSN